MNGELESIIPPINLPKILELNPQILDEKEQIKSMAIIGSFDHIKRLYRQRYLGVGWGTTSTYLRLCGAVYLPRRKCILIDTDTYPGVHSEIALEHEVTERLFEDKTSQCREVLDKLGLMKPLTQQSNLAHHLAVVYELVMAKRKRDT